MVICLEQGADLRMAQLMPLPLAVSCFSKIRIGFTFLVPAGPLNGCVCVQASRCELYVCSSRFLNVVNSDIALYCLAGPGEGFLSQ